MPNNEGKQKYIVTVTVQCNAVSVGALRTNLVEYLGNLINLNYVKYENHLIYLNINNVANNVHL